MEAVNLFPLSNSKTVRKVSSKVDFWNPFDRDFKSKMKIFQNYICQLFCNFFCDICRLLYKNFFWLFYTANFFMLYASLFSFWNPFDRDSKSKMKIFQNYICQLFCNFFCDICRLLYKIFFWLFYTANFFMLYASLFSFCSFLQMLKHN